MSNDFETSPTSPTSERTMRVPPLFLLGGFLIAGTAGSAFFVLPDESPTTTISSMVTISADGTSVGQPDVSGETGSAESVENTDSRNIPDEQIDPETARLSELIVGDWQQDFYGERTLSVKADGTATMTILPSGVFAFGFGPKIDLTMFWSVKDGHLDYGISGGTPEDKVKLAAKSWGDHWVEKIITLDENKLDLLSVDGSSHSIWQRASPRFDPQAELKNAD